MTDTQSTSETSQPSAPSVEQRHTIRVSFADVLANRAYLRIPFVGRLLLAHMAGAPWSDKKPNAFLHGLQVEVMAHEEREQIVHGASRLGKSVLGGCRLVEKTMLPRRKVAVVAKRYDHVAHEFQYLYKGMKLLFAGHGQAFIRLIYRHQLQYHDYDCHTVWGARAIGISVEADDGAQLLGRELTDVVLGEGSHIPPHIFETKLLRALDGAMMAREHGGTEHIGNIYIFTTPKEFEGCSAAEWDRVHRTTKQQPWLLECGTDTPWHETVWIREADILENPEYDTRVYQARKKSLSKRAFDEQYRGKMSFASGRVYQGFDADRHIIPMPEPSAIRRMRLGVGIDPGGQKGIALVGHDMDRRTFLLGEVYTEGRTIYQTLDETKDMLLEALGPVFPARDVEAMVQGIDLWGVDPAAQDKLEIMEYLGISLQWVNTRDDKDVLATTGRIDQWFYEDRCFIVDECVIAIDMIKKYVWDYQTIKQAGGKVLKKPRKAYDHVLDAFRFAAILLDNLGPLEVEPEPATMAEAWEKMNREAFFGPLKEYLRLGAQREEALKRAYVRQ